MPQEIEVDRRQAVERPAFVARDRDRLQEHLGQHHRGSAIQVDAALEPRDRTITKYLKSRRLRFADRRARRLRMHVDDVGADRDMRGQRDLQPPRGGRHADLRKRRARLVQVLADRLAEAEARGDAVA